LAPGFSSKFCGISSYVAKNTCTHERKLQRQGCKNLQLHQCLVRFENKNIFFYFEKCSCLLHTTLAL
jgi:hypothetical protein